MKKIKKISETIGIILAGTVLVFLSSISTDFFITIIILSVSVFLFLFALKSKYDLLLKTLSIFVIIHFLIFPYVYVLFLKHDPSSFSIDLEIEQNEILIAQQEIQEKYRINDLETTKGIIIKLLNNNNPYLDSTFNYINQDNIVFIDSVILHKTATYIEEGPPSAGFSTLSICDIEGQNIANIVGEYGNNISKQLTIREFLKDELSKITETFSKLNHDKKKIEDKNIWTYRKILAYSLNIFDTDNMKPITRFANAIFFFHKFFVVIFILGIIGSTFHDLLTKKEEIIKSQHTTKN